MGQRKNTKKQDKKPQPRKSGTPATGKPRDTGDDWTNLTRVGERAFLLGYWNK